MPENTPKHTHIHIIKCRQCLQSSTGKSDSFWWISSFGWFLPISSSSVKL